MFDLESALGIEIRGEDLILAAVAKGIQGYTLKGHQTIEEYRDLESSELHKKVQNFLRSTGFNRENIIVGIPRDRMIIRSVELPLEVEENLAQVVQFQTMKLEPSEEVSSWSDFVVLDRNEKEKSILLQIGMIPKATLDGLLELLQELNLYPAAVRFASLGLQQLLRVHTLGYGKNPSLIVDLRDDLLEIVVAAGPDRCYAHRKDFACEGYDLEAILCELDIFVPRLHLGVKGFDRMFLCGSRAEEFLESLTERFTDCELLGSSLQIKIGGAPNQLKDHLFVATGLAISGIQRSNYSRFNLIPSRRRLVGHRASYVPTLVMAIFFVVLLVAVSAQGFFQQQQLLAAMDREVERLKPEMEAALAAQEALEESNAQALALSEIMIGRHTVLAVLKELTERIPDDTYLQNMNVEKEKVTITGNSESANSVLNILRASDLFESVQSRYITQDRATQLEKFNFELILRQPEPALP